MNDLIRSIDVSGSAKMSVAPDEIILKVNLREYWEEEFQQGKKYEDFKTKHPLENIDKSFHMALKANEISDENVVVENQGSRWRGRGKENLFEKSYTISFKDFKSVQRLQDSLEFKGIESATIHKLKHKDLEQFKLKVKGDALLAGKKKAIFLAETLGEKIGRVINISEQKIDRPVVHRGARMMAAQGMESDNNEYGNNFRKIPIHYKVFITFQLLD